MVKLDEFAVRKNEVKPRPLIEVYLRRNTRTTETVDWKTKLQILPYLSEEAEWRSALRPAHYRQSKERAQRTTELSERNRDEVTSESDRHMLREQTQGTPEVQGPAEVTRDPGSVVKHSASWLMRAVIVVKPNTSWLLLVIVASVRGGGGERTRADVVSKENVETKVFLSLWSLWYKQEKQAN